MSEVVINMNKRVWFTGYREYVMGTTSYTASMVHNEFEKYHQEMYLYMSPRNYLWRNASGHSRGDLEYWNKDQWIHYVTLDFAFKKIVFDSDDVLWIIAYGVNYDNFLV